MSVSKKGLYTFWKTLREAPNKRKYKRSIVYYSCVRLFDKDEFEFCPLTYCANVLNKGKYDTSDYAVAAKRLGIDDEDYIASIIRAADSNIDSSTLDDRQKKIRRKLFKVLKIRNAKP